jgi:hypothetical protein
VLRVITANVAGVFVARAERSGRFVAEMGSACAALRALSLACRDMRAAVEEAGLWLRLLEAMHARQGEDHQRDTHEALRLVRDGSVDARRALRLVGMSGCQLCGRARVRKVHWPFRVRCCEPCLRAHTISDYRLRKELGVSYAELEGLHHSTHEFLSWSDSSFTMRFFWRDDPTIVRAAAMRNGVPRALATTLDNVQAVIEARARARRARAQVLAHQHQHQQQLQLQRG